MALSICGDSGQNWLLKWSSVCYDILMRACILSRDRDCSFSPDYADETNTILEGQSWIRPKTIFMSNVSLFSWISWDSERGRHLSKVTKWGNNDSRIKLSLQARNFCNHFRSPEDIKDRAGTYDEGAGVHDEGAGDHDQGVGAHDEGAGVHDEETGVHDLGRLSKSLLCFFFPPWIKCIW